VDLKAEYTA